MHPELRKFIREHFGLARPPGMRGLQTMRRIGGTQLARLHDEGNQTSRKREKEKRITKPAAKIHSCHYGLYNGNDMSLTRRTLLALPAALPFLNLVTGTAEAEDLYYPPSDANGGWRTLTQPAEI